ncbi:MAG: hypothetical protein L0323_03745 [Planctomycetes bacterium]|nr:hypothetical protein [Planctomycetota bacterium]
MTEPGPAGPRIGATLLGLGAVLVVLGGLAYFGARLHRRMLLDSADPGRQRALLLEVLGRDQPPEGWRIGRAFDLPPRRVLLFVGLGGNPPVNVTAYVGADAGKEAAQAWIRSETAPAPAAVFDLRNVRRLSRATVPTPGGEIPFALIEGEDRQGIQRRALYDLRGSPLPHPVDIQVSGAPGTPIDLEAAARFVSALLADTPATRSVDSRPPTAGR